jgi:ubiquinone/menaquinone biosynthesis C-methylase UbiE
MTHPPHSRPDVEPARSFDLVADAYDRGRPSYPDEAVDWLLEDRRGDGNRSVLELGAGTGKLTESLLARGCTVTATDPSAAMLARLRSRAPSAAPVLGLAESIPVRARSVHLVVAAQCFHWFDAPRTLDEVARVLRPGGRFAVVWNQRDERIPWVRRLGAIIGSTEAQPDPTEVIDESGMFETVERATFRFWQPMSQQALRDLVASRSAVALMSELERDRVLRKVDELYAGYGRGADGMLLPYVTTVCRAAVLPWAVRGESDPAGPSGGSLPPGVMDDDALLIDFR